MNTIVEGFGGSVVFGLWNEESEQLTIHKKYPRKLKKKIRNIMKYDIKFKKNIVEYVINKQVKDWYSSFALTISKEKRDSSYVLYMKPYISKDEKLKRKDIIYRREDDKTTHFNNIILK